MNDSLFENINSHCVGLNTASLHLNYDIFNNPDLEVPSRKLADDSIFETDGISWLTSRGQFMRNRTNIISCKLSGNKIILLESKVVYGGAISAEVPFMTLKVQNNQFINNSAVNSGGAYYLIPSIKVSIFY